MSICRSMLFVPHSNERRSQDSGVIQTLNFGDSDGEMDSSLNDASMESVDDFPKTPSRGESKWLTCVTPITSPVGHRQVAVVSPIAYKYDCPDLEETSPSISRSGRIRDKTARSPSFTPPHKRLKSLRLFDTPHTPASLIQKAQRRVCRPRSRINLEDVVESTPSPRALSSLDPSKPQANVNPFTPENNTSLHGSLNNSVVLQNSSVITLSVSGSTGLKRPRHPSMNGSALDNSLEVSMADENELPPNKKLALHDINTSRYKEEFHEVCKLGDGEFGSVCCCIHRLDGCTYAIKKSKRPVAGSVYERTALNEVYAHSVLGQHPYVVRYYSAWAENDHMYIQNEYCNGGSLAEVCAQRRQSGQSAGLPEEELQTLLLQISYGLRYIHSLNLVHLDIKPGNIFIHYNQNLSPSAGNIDEIAPILYKIGDLGHVTLSTNPQVEDGDCRYLAAEILAEDCSQLTKADIFSLALTVFQAGFDGDLPKNGEEWHAIRRGELPELPQCSADFNALLKSMIRPDASERPSADALVHNHVLVPFENKSRDQLRRELNQEKLKNEILQRQLKEAAEVSDSGPNLLKNSRLLGGAGGRKSRIIGQKVNRSMSFA